jgi:hypothetical protein
VKALLSTTWFRLGTVAGAAVFCWLLLGATAWAAPPTAPFNECPAIGLDSSCALLIYISDNGVQVLSDPSQGPYEGDEDTLIGVLNDTSGTTLSSLPITGSSSPAIFDFEGDGICASPNPTSGLPGIDCSSNPNATTGYEGLNSSFSGISGDLQSGTVNFNTPLAPGDSTFFSLEGPISASSLTIISATGTSISPVEGASFSGTVATLHSTASEPAGNFSATIDWGDSTTSSGTVSGSGGTYDVSGTHTYAEEGSHTVTVTITDSSDSQSVSTTTQATVADAALTSACPTALVSPQAFSGSTLTFTDANPGATTADYTTVSINWGDSHTTNGTVSGPSGGQFTVTGTHTYTSTGMFTITTTVKDDGGAMTSQSCSAVVFAFAPGRGGFVIGDNNSAKNTAVTFWGPQWNKLNSLSGGPAPSAFKGYALNPATPACGTTWSTDPGNSAPPPAGPLPAFMGVIVSSSITMSGMQISGNTAHIVVVQTNAGYAPNVGHAGTGTVVAQFC